MANVSVEVNMLWARRLMHDLLWTRRLMCKGLHTDSSVLAGHGDVHCKVFDPFWCRRETIVERLSFLTLQIKLKWGSQLCIGSWASTHAEKYWLAHTSIDQCPDPPGGSWDLLTWQSPENVFFEITWELATTNCWEQRHEYNSLFLRLPLLPTLSDLRTRICGAEIVPAYGSTTRVCTRRS
jgi:hypothetical protein